jgi:hypothetical protein
MTLTHNQTTTETLWQTQCPNPSHAVAEGRSQQAAEILEHIADSVQEREERVHVARHWQTRVVGIAGRIGRSRDR